MEQPVTLSDRMGASAKSHSLEFKSVYYLRMKDVIILSFDTLYLKVFSCGCTAFRNHGVDGICPQIVICLYRNMISLCDYFPTATFTCPKRTLRRPDAFALWKMELNGPTFPFSL